MANIREHILTIQSEDIQKLVISKPATKQEAYKKIVVERKSDYYQFSCYTEKQVFHDNVKPEKLAEKVAEVTDGHYRQINLWTNEREHSILISKKGDCHHTLGKKTNLSSICEDNTCGVQTAHNRNKNYLIAEGTIVPPLIDMGIFTKDGKVVRSMYDKYKQINRFLEIIDDEVSTNKSEKLHIIDFGCGKSYLTFIVYYYLTEILHRDVEMTGLDLKEDVIAKCNVAAEKYGYNSLHFEVGDIGGYETTREVDMVITLHACDTATDHALYNAVKWKAKMIFSVPCCQHELNQQMHSEEFALLTRYGIVKERFAALATDAIRANLLESVGYKTQLLEFVDLAHTPKNILIRSVRRPITPAGIKKQAMAEVEAFREEFHVEPTLYRLLKENGYL